MKSLRMGEGKGESRGEPAKLSSLQMMEATGGEQDVVGHDKKTGEYIVFDCSALTPHGWLTLCYNDEVLAARKEHKPKGSAVAMAASPEANAKPALPPSRSAMQRSNAMRVGFLVRA